MKKIVVGTDFNDLAAAALRFAGTLAQRTGAELIVVYADTFEPPAEFTATQLPDIAGAIEHSRKATQQQLRMHVAKHVSPNVVSRAIVADGLPSTAIAAIADEQRADFICVGTHGRGGLQRLMLGSVAEALIREARVPVLTVRSAEVPAVVRNILCPVNATAAAAEAAARAANIASALGAALTLLQVSGNGDETFDAATLAPGASVLRRESGDEHPASRILEIADGGAYDLIVVGAEHKLVRDVTLFGTTTASVTRHARTPVLTVTRHVREEQPELATLSARH